MLPTRPPLHDKGEGQPRRHLRPSSTALERAVHAPFDLFFQRCARNVVTLADAPAEKLPEEKRNRRSTTYYQYTRNGLEVTWAFYKTLDGRKPSSSRDRTTAVFLVYVPALWKDGPGLLSAFGMGANETLLWCHLLRTRMNQSAARGAALAGAPLRDVRAGHHAPPGPPEPLRAPLDLLTLTSAAEHWQVEPIVDFSIGAWSPPQPETFAVPAARPRAAGGRH